MASAVDNEDDTARFVQGLISEQERLLVYVLTLLGNLHDARDLLQETNLVLWQKRNDFVAGTEFGAWARKVAYFQILAHLRDKKRDRHLFDAELLQQIAALPPVEGDTDERRLALRHCLSVLSSDLRTLIAQRYSLGASIRDLARSSGKSESAIKTTLLRVRQALSRCIHEKLASA